ncbi:MAG: 4'-phosphopantetheinyl transferase superfamily protein [Verrucomicrobiaceae bacterium]|nr:MAG: 4'-phosphopantetheinyl transferase superfamily protein [Verrucomicrobiaceae bacterium]
MPSHPVSIHVIRPGGISPERVAACLTDHEKLRAGRFKFGKDAVQWSAYRAGLRVILGQSLGLHPVEVPLVFSETGKPGLAPPHDHLHFNLSHCDGLALLALSPNGPVGIDLEPVDRAGSLLECETSFCHPDEITTLPPSPGERACQLLRIWTAKEAILKALGTGLSHPPDAVTLHFEGDAGRATSERCLEGIENFRFHLLRHPSLEGFQAVLALSEADDAFKMHEEA